MARDIDFGFIPGLQHCGRAAVLVGGRTSVRDGVRHEDGAAVPDRLRAGVPDHDAAGQFAYGTTVNVRNKAIDLTILIVCHRSSICGCTS